MRLKKNFITKIIVLMFVLLTDISLFGQQFLYLDPGQPINKRVEDLLSRMTIWKKKSGR